MILKSQSNGHLIIPILIIFLFLALMINFYDFEPGIDQIRQMSWANSLNQSEYFISRELIKEKGLMYNDEKSFLVNLIKTGYSDIGHLFNLTVIIILYLLNLIFSNEIIVFNTVSIFCFSLNTYFVILIYELYFNDNTKDHIINKILIFISIVPSYYLLFSPLGSHNISVFFLLLSFYYLKKYENDPKLLIFNLLIIFSSLSIFSHKINTVTLPILIFFSLIINKKYKETAIYSFVTLIILLPIFFIITLKPETLSASNKFANLEFSLIGYINNFFIFFKNIFLTIGPIFLVFFVFGLVKFLSNFVIYKNFLIFIFTFLVLCVFVNDFQKYYIRSNLYINYFVILIALFTIFNLRNKINARLRNILTVLIILNAFLNLIPNKKINLYNNYYSKLYSEYYNNNGKLSNSLIKIEKNFGDQDSLIYLDNKIQDYTKIYIKSVYNKNKIQIKPLKNLIGNQINQTKLEIDFYKKNIFLISMEQSLGEISAIIAKININEIFSCKVKSTNIFKMKNVNPINDNLYLNKVECI